MSFGLVKRTDLQAKLFERITQLAQDITNWLVFKIFLPTTTRKLAKPCPNPSPLKDKIFSRKQTTSESKERFHLLEQSREENVIAEK
jgi:hypothetical protein